MSSTMTQPPKNPCVLQGNPMKSSCISGEDSGRGYSVKHSMGTSTQQCNFRITDVTLK